MMKPKIFPPMSVLPFVLAAMVVMAWAPVAWAQQVHFTFNVVGPGAIVTCCPEPNFAGQGYQIIAQPLANARFVQWEDGTTSAKRYFIASTNLTQFTAWFEDIISVPYLVQHGLQNINPTLHPISEFAQDGTRLRLSFVLPGRNGYQVLGSTNLLSTVFSPVPFAVTPDGPASLTQNFGEVGPVSLWMDPATNAAQFWFKIMLDNQITLPAIYFAQASVARPGGSVLLFGDNLAGAIQASANGAALTASGVDNHSVSITMPSVAGLYPVLVKVGGVAALGAVSIRVSTNAADFPLVSGLANMQVTAGGTLQVNGTNFNSLMEAFLDGQSVSIVGVASDGSSLVVRVPGGMSGSHSLMLVRNGALSSAINVNVVASSFAYTPAAKQGVRLYSWLPYQPNVYSYTASGTHGVEVYTWTPTSPGSYTYPPAATKGVSVYTWQPSSPGSYTYMSAAGKGIKLYTWQPYSPGSYFYSPATARGVKVSAP